MITSAVNDLDQLPFFENKIILSNYNKLSHKKYNIAIKQLKPKQGGEGLPATCKVSM